MTGKSFYLIGFLLAIAATIVVSSEKSKLSEIYPNYKANNSHNLIAGARLPGDRLVLRKKIVIASEWMHTVTIQPTFNVSRYEKITQLRALDQRTDGTGATASILSGGPGTSNVTLRIKSIYEQGINFIVELYAR